MSHHATNDEITGWFAGRLTDGWFVGAPEITVDREEILVVGTLADIELPADASDAARAAEATLQTMVEVFAPHHMNVGDLQAPGEGAPMEVVAERFAGICDRAAERGTRVALEFLPWTRLGDLATALEVVHTAGRANGGVLIDAWHYFRGRPDPELLRGLSAQDVVAVQLDDADPGVVGPLFEDTMLRRRLPGDGSFDLIELVQILDAVGVEVPFSVEMMSTVEQSLPVDDAARRAHDAAVRVLARARSRAR